MRTGSKRGYFATQGEYSSRFGARQKTCRGVCLYFSRGVPRDRHSPCRDHPRRPIAGLKTKLALDTILAAKRVISPVRSPRPLMRCDWIRASCQKKPASPLAGHIGRYYVGGSCEVRTDEKIPSGKQKPAKRHPLPPTSHTAFPTRTKRAIVTIRRAGVRPSGSDDGARDPARWFFDPQSAIRNPQCNPLL